LPADFETFGQAVATSMADLLGGTSGQVLSKASNTDMDFAWVTTDDANAIQNSIVDAKGDLIGATANDTPARLAVGTNGQVLAADSTAATGLAWTTPSGPAFRAYRTTSNQTFSQNTWTKIQLNGESYDTASCFDSTTNYRFTPNKAGYYQINGAPWDERSGTGLVYVGIWKNGSEAALLGVNTSSTTQAIMVSDLIYFNGSTDYVELYIYDQAATSRAIAYAFGPQSYFSGVWIRS
jgi:hypothetical protein